MQTKLATAVDAVAELLNQAAARGHLVIVRASPPPQVDTRTPLIMALNRLFGLTPTESRALIALLENKQVSREALHTATSHDGNPVSKIKTIDVSICKLRKKLTRHGIEVDTIYGLGFKLAEGARDRIYQQLADAGFDPASLTVVKQHVAVDE